MHVNFKAKCVLACSSHLYSSTGPAEANFFGQAMVKISVDNGCRGGS